MEENFTCTFSADFGKGMRHLVGYLAKDEWPHKELMNACLDLRRSEIAASDGIVLAVSHIPVSGLEKDAPTLPILLNARMLRRLKGVCRFEVTQKYVKAYDEEGNDYANYVSEMRYPNYLAVIPKLSSQAHACLPKESVRKILRFAKELKGFGQTPAINIDINPGERDMWLWTKDDKVSEMKQIRVTMEHPLGVTIRTAVNRKHLRLLKDWTGGMWFGIDEYRPVIFDTKNEKLVLAMPCYRHDNEGYDLDTVTFRINPFKRLEKSYVPKVR